MTETIKKIKGASVVGKKVTFRPIN